MQKETNSTATLGNESLKIQKLSLPKSAKIMHLSIDRSRRHAPRQRNSSYRAEREQRAAIKVHHFFSEVPQFGKLNLDPSQKLVWRKIKTATDRMKSPTAYRYTSRVMPKKMAGVRRFGVKATPSSFLRRVLRKRCTPFFLRFLILGA